MWWWLGSKPAIEFLTGYLVEWSLSMDNVFVFAVVFAYFKVPLKYQYRVLFWGILGAVVMRLTFVIVGAELVERFKWLFWLFGAFLVYTGIKLAFGDEDVHPEDNFLLKLVRRVIPVTTQQTGDRFFVREAGKLVATPLFLVLLVVESTDVLFAVDSVPAIFGVVDQDADYFRFIVFTSNVFAILGLRALYFALAAVIHRFKYLKPALALILVFIGAKVFIAGFAGWEKFPASISLGVTVALLAGGIGYSLWRTRAAPAPARP